MTPIRYLKVRGDYKSTGLWDETSYLQVDPRDLNLPAELIERLSALVANCRPIIASSIDWLQTPEKERELIIQAIDEEGLDLTKEIAKFLGDKYSLRYYSEGLQRYLEV